MEWQARIRFTAPQKAGLWERWQGGQCVADIARALGRRNKSGVYRFSQTYLNRIAQRLNQRPRKTLGYEAPADKLGLVLN